MESVENVGTLVVGFGWLMACETVHRRTTTRRASWGSPRRNDRPRATAGGLRVVAPRLLLGVGVGTPVVTPFELDPFRGGGGGGGVLGSRVASGGGDLGVSPPLEASVSVVASAGASSSIAIRLR